MELVPILSTIILVGTIATFILAVFAYILYKVRERRTREAAGQQRQYVETRRTQMAPAARPIGAQIGQPSAASMYIAPTTSLPPQGPVVEVEHMREAAPPVGGWQQPPSLEHAIAAPSSYDRGEVSGHRRPTQRIVRPQPQELEPRRIESEAGREPSSLFWEYTDEGFVPVDPNKSARREEARAGQRRSAEDEEGSAWL